MIDIKKLNIIDLQNHDFWVLKPENGSLSISLSNHPSLIESKIGNKILEKDIIYLRMAEIWAERSYCKRSQVGCLIVKDKSIISDGYNGSPYGFPNVCEDTDNNTLPYVLHAEANAITKLAKSTLSSDSSTIYVTLSPCFECSKLIIQSGVKRLVIKDLYRKIESISLLLEAGVEITRIGKY
jgi:dCMP deaminase